MKKYLLSILCLTLIAGAAIGTGSGYTELELQIANNFAKKGIIIDYSKNPELYRLNENITRSELMAIALKIKGVKLPDEFVCQGHYADVVDNNWICRTVELAYDNQLIRSPSAGKDTARPLDVVTRAEALAILLKANGLTYTKNVARGSYPSDTPQWQIDVMEGAVKLKIIPTAQGRGPNTIIKRKEVLGLAHNMKYATGEYKSAELKVTPPVVTPPSTNTSTPELNSAEAERNILNHDILINQDTVDKLKYTFSVGPNAVQGTIKSINWYIAQASVTNPTQSLGTGPIYTYTFTESGVYNIIAKIEDSLGNILTEKTIATITITGGGTVTPPVKPPTTGNIISGEASAPPKAGDKVSIELNGTPLEFTVGVKSTTTITEVDTAVRTMNIGDKKDIVLSTLVAGKVKTETFVLELMDIQRKTVSDTVLADFKITAPTEVKVNTTFDVTLTAINNSGKTLTGYAGEVFFDTTTDPSNFIFPNFTSSYDNTKYWGYKFIPSDNGTHTIVKGFSFTKIGDYEIDFFDLDVPPAGVIKTIKIKVTN